MARRDYLNDPNAPKANSIVPSVTAIVTNPAGEHQRVDARRCLVDQRQPHFPRNSAPGRVQRDQLRVQARG